MYFHIRQSVSFACTTNWLIIFKIMHFFSRQMSAVLVSQTIASQIKHFTTLPLYGRNTLASCLPCEFSYIPMALDMFARKLQQKSSRDASSESWRADEFRNPFLTAVKQPGVHQAADRQSDSNELRRRGAASFTI